METWIEGNLVGGSRKYGKTAEEVRARECPESDGWKHVADEGFPAATKGTRLYLFRVVED
jgi:hypothetical protein